MLSDMITLITLIIIMMMIKNPLGNKNQKKECRTALISEAVTGKINVRRGIVYPLNEKIALWLLSFNSLPKEAI